MAEALLGYSLHSWLAVGHLVEAETELLADFPNEAIRVRAERVNYIDSLEFTLTTDNSLELKAPYGVDTLDLIRRLTIIETGINSLATKPKKPRKRPKRHSS